MSSLNNQTGAEGNKFEFIAKNKVTAIGMGCSNRAPATRVDKHGTPYCKFSLSPTLGTIPIYGSIPSAGIVDTAIVHPQGSWSLGIGNKWSITVGSGGISVQNVGPYVNNSDYMVLFGNVRTNLHSGSVVDIKSGDVITLNSKKILMSCEEMVINNTVKVNNNVVVNGGLFVRGEAFFTHMTMMSQPMRTEDSGVINSYINPNQSFAVMGANSVIAQSKLLTTFGGLLSTISGSFDDIDGFIEIILTLPLPSPIDRIITIPAKIAFPYGIRLMSDSVYGMNPVKSEEAWENRPEVGVGLTKGDAIAMGHEHQFTGPAGKFVSSTDEIYKKVSSSKIMENKPINHNKAEYGGVSDWFGQWAENQKKKITDGLTSFSIFG